VATDPLASVLQELTSARKIVAKSTNRQIRNREDRDILSATAFAWFQSHRKRIPATADPDLLEKANAAYRAILDATAKNSAQATYLEAMASAREAVIGLRSSIASTPGGPLVETAPDFSPLVGDATMRNILERRWDECQKCLGAGANLAAIVMMGGLLEALFVARANRMTNKAALFKARATPLDSKTKKPIDLRDWTLGPYIDVGHELGWITRSGKDVAAVLRDYRNYIHPEKERSHGIVLNPHDSAMLWDVTKNLTRQVLASAQQSP
jgi:hypothetical protein